MSGFLWYRDQKKLSIGDISRYKIEYKTDDVTLTEIYLRVKNLEKTPLRAIHLLNGPFILYAHVIPCNYNHKAEFKPDDPRLNSETVFKNTIKPGQTFNVKLYLNKNSLKIDNEDGSHTYAWSCDIISQIVLNRKASVLYDFMIGDDLYNMQRLNRSVITSLTKGDMAVAQDESLKNEIESDYTYGVSKNPNLLVSCLLTDDIWHVQPHDTKSPIHLIIITHGLFSNLTADMLYLRDRLATLDDNVVIAGYRGNAGRTEKGIHKLGVGVSFYVISLIEKLQKADIVIDKMSFVAHSLGGPVQLYALKHILLLKGLDFFTRNHIQLQNFVCIASPMLGVLSEMSLWISWFLDIGTLGKTGRDLTLLKKLPLLRNESTNAKRDHFKPILETLPDEPAQSLLRLFRLRTVYANAFNDGIVPLRTSSLLYLDWAAMGDVSELRAHPEHMKQRSFADNHSAVTTQTNALGHDVGEVPYDGSSSDDNSSDSAEASHSDDQNERKDSLLSFNLFQEKKLLRRKKWYSQISAKGTNLSQVEASEADEVNGDEGESSIYNIPPKASAIESALSTLLCPVPSRKYINTPDERTPVVFHDRFYHFDSIPSDNPPHIGPLKRIFRSKEWKLEKQVKIARKYHTKDLDWRKVLVYLPPDAHNNIIVRRRFANGYGWGVIDHLVDQIFSERKLTAKI